jgi:peptidoglycan-associated lipoprotein
MTKTLFAKKALLGLAAVTAFGLVFLACSKKPEPVAVEPPPPPPPVVEEPEPPPPPPPPPEPQEDPLEKERQRLEALMNQIMGDEIYFEYDKSTLTQQAKDLLTQVGDILVREPRFSVLNEGNTDERGTENYNLGLGGRRADAVVKFLIDYGVPANRLTKRSLGEENPKDSGHDESAWSQNRRVEFKVTLN